MDTCETALEIGDNSMDSYTNLHLTNTLQALNAGVNENIPPQYHFESSTDGIGRFQINLRTSKGCNTFTYYGPNTELAQEVANLIIYKIVHGPDAEITTDRIGELLGYGDNGIYAEYHSELVNFLDRIPLYE